MWKLRLLRGHAEHWRLAVTASLWDLSLPHRSPCPERHRLLWVSCGSWGKECIPKTCTFGISPSSPLSHPRFVPIVRDSRAVRVCVRFVSTRKWNKFCNFFKCMSIFWCFSPWVIGLQVTAVVQAKLTDPFSDIGLHRARRGGWWAAGHARVLSEAVSGTALAEEHLHKCSLKKLTGNMEKEKVVLPFDRGNEALICTKLHVRKNTGVSWQQGLLMVSGPAKARRFALPALQPGPEKQQQKLLTHCCSIKTSGYLIFTTESRHKRLPRF